MKLQSHTTILSITFGFLVINFFLNSEILNYSLLILIAGSLFSEKFSDFIEMIWNKIALILSYFVPNILLTFVFYCILTPLALMAKFFKSESDYITNNNNLSNFRISKRDFNKQFFEKTW
jgi:cytochrome c oxidase subunit IV